MTCWRRLRDWQAAGLWEKLHLAMLHRLREHDQIYWGHANLDAASVSSSRGLETGANPTDWGRLCSKRHLAVDARGVFLAITVTWGSRHDSMAVESMLNAIPVAPGLDSLSRKRPGKLRADKGYGCHRCRRDLK
ncbi:transposase [Burkholderia cepacia]|uniref:transposase n=1 Tax=Burkholderia cepacia TaxID=292 RepID=UPI0012D3E5C5